MSQHNADENSTGGPVFYTVGPDQEGERLDKGLAALSADLSRARIQALIAQGHVRVNNSACLAASTRLKEGDQIQIDIPAPVSAVPEPQQINLDILYEDEDLLVLNKQAGMVVHPGAGNHSGTLVNALLHHCADTLSGIGGVARPGIVHRLDKETSGAMLVAKHDRAHRALADQLSDRSLSRIYHAIVLGTPMPPMGRIDQPVGRDARNRLKMSVNKRIGKQALTHYTVKSVLRGGLSEIECRLESGRTHQIRVHMSFAGHPLIGDPLYGPQPTALRAALRREDMKEEDLNAVMDFPRQALHAASIGFLHPVSGTPMRFDAPAPEDYAKLLNMLRKI